MEDNVRNNCEMMIAEAFCGIASASEENGRLTVTEEDGDSISKAINHAVISAGLGGSARSHVSEDGDELHIIVTGCGSVRGFHAYQNGGFMTIGTHYWSGGAMVSKREGACDISMSFDTAIKVMRLAAVSTVNQIFRMAQI